MAIERMKWKLRLKRVDGIRLLKQAVAVKMFGYEAWNEKWDDQ
jgi:hypothetical protein